MLTNERRPHAGGHSGTGGQDEGETGSGERVKGGEGGGGKVRRGGERVGGVGGGGGGGIGGVGGESVGSEGGRREGVGLEGEAGRREGGAEGAGGEGGGAGGYVGRVTEASMVSSASQVSRTRKRDPETTPPPPEAPPLRGSPAAASGERSDLSACRGRRCHREAAKGGREGGGGGGGEGGKGGGRAKDGEEGRGGEGGKRGEGEEGGRVGEGGKREEEGEGGRGGDGGGVVDGSIPRFLCVARHTINFPSDVVKLPHIFPPSATPADKRGAGKVVEGSKRQKEDEGEGEEDRRRRKRVCGKDDSPQHLPDLLQEASRSSGSTDTKSSPSTPTPLLKSSKIPTSARARPRLAPCPRGLSKEPLLLLIALLACTCTALPTLSPITYPHPALTAQEPANQEWRQCCDTGYPPTNQSGNLTVLRTSPTSVLVTWTRQSPPHVKYEVTYKPTNAKYRVVVEVLAPQSSVMLERLLPLTQYQVHVSIIGNNSALWTSPVVTFHTTRDDVFQVFNNSTPTIIDAIDVSVGGIEGSDVTPLENLGGLDQKVGLVRVRAEEVGIVLLVLAVWMFAIALFFNRWGKIRMLEPYQEPYKEAPPQLLQHRPSCPMADPYALPTNPLKIEHNGRNRPRQNSVFVGRTRSLSLEVHPPRRVKSALNLTTMVLQESEEEAGGVATTFT